MHTQNRIYRSGFTIIELLVVIVVIGLLVSIITASLANAQRQARDNVRKTTVHNIANAVESFYAVNKRFPGKTTGTASTSSYSGTDAPCEQTDSSGVYSYYYIKSLDCSSVSTTFLPAPTWIPEMGAFLSPFPTETNYQGIDGTSTATATDILSASDSSTTNKTRTYEYRHLAQGAYFVASRLEGSTSDPLSYSGTASAPASVSTTTGVPLSVTGSNIYLITK